MEFVKIELHVHTSKHYRDLKTLPSLDLEVLCVLYELCIHIVLIENVFIMYACTTAIKSQATTSLNMKGNNKVLLSEYAAMQCIESSWH